MVADTPRGTLLLTLLPSLLRVSLVRVSLIRVSIVSLPLLWAGSPVQADEGTTSPPSAGFWMYYLQYGTDDGDVFDPNDLEDITALMKREAEKHPEAASEAEPETEDD